MWLVAPVPGSTTLLIPSNIPGTTRLKVVAPMPFPDGRDLMTARITTLPTQKLTERRDMCEGAAVKSTDLQQP